MDILKGTCKEVKIERKVLNNQNEVESIELIRNIDVPSGTRENDEFFCSQLGDHIDRNRIPADIVFVAKNIPHNFFKREGDDIVFTLRMTQSEANQGGTWTIPTLDDGLQKKISCKQVPKDYSKRFLKFGLPNKSNKIRGNLIVKAEIENDVNQGILIIHI